MMDTATQMTLTALMGIMKANNFATLAGPMMAVMMLAIIHQYRLLAQCAAKHDKILEELARYGCLQENCPQRRTTDRRIVAPFDGASRDH